MDRRRVREQQLAGTRLHAHTVTGIAPGYELELVRLSESATFDEEAYWFSLVLSVDDVRPEDDEIEYTLSMVDNFGEIRTEELLIPLSEPTDLSITFDENRRVFFVEKNGQNILYGHFDMDPLYDSDEPGIRFPRAGTYGDLTIDQRSVETPWCDRLLATAGR